jgi:ketosteroid isomerase-like protein
MRRFRLNLWQRIGVMLCLVWIVIGGSWGWRHAYDKADAEFRVCIAAVKSVADVQACRDTRFRAIAVPRGVSAAIVALAPITVVGLFIYGLVWLVRRTRRAFSPEPRRVDAAQRPPTAPNEERTLSPANPGPMPAALASGPVAIGLPTRTAAPVAPDIRKSANKRTVEKYMDAFARSDHHQVLSCLTDDVEWVIPGAFHLKGKDAFDKEIENPAFVGSPLITVTRLTEEGDVVVAEGSVRAARRDGGYLDAVFCDVFEMRDEKIRRLISYLMEIKSA